MLPPPPELTFDNLAGRNAKRESPRTVDEKQKADIRNKIRSFQESEARRAKPTPKWVARLGWTSLVLIAASPPFVAAYLAAVNYAEYNSINEVATAGYLSGELVRSVFLALVLRALWYQYKHPERETFGSFRAFWKRIKRG